MVAHPDDEIIWMGGLIIRHQKWDWNIISLCRASDSDRKPRFLQAAKELGASAHIFDIDDSPILAALSPDLHELKESISSVALFNPDIIFTHGEKGEYTRHQRHEQTHRAVREMADSGTLKGERLFFAYDDCNGKRLPAPSKDADILLNLQDDEYAEKRRIIHDIYGFGYDSFEYNACGQTEAYNFHSNSDVSNLIRVNIQELD